MAFSPVAKPWWPEYELRSVAFNLGLQTRHGYKCRTFLFRIRISIDFSMPEPMFIVFTLNAYEKYTTSTVACNLPLRPSQYSNDAAGIKVRKTDWHVTCIVLGNRPWYTLEAYDSSFSHVLVFKKFNRNIYIIKYRIAILKKTHDISNWHPSIVKVSNLEISRLSQHFLAFFAVKTTLSTRKVQAN